MPCQAAKGPGRYGGTGARASIVNWKLHGRLYGLPSLMNTYGVWYNVAMFQAARLSLPRIGWTGSVTTFDLRSVR
jgi:maltose-binding protein MalE